MTMITWARPALISFLGWCLLAFSSAARADWTSFTGAELSSTVAEVFIDQARIALRLEIGDRDRSAFATLLEARPTVVAQGDTPRAANMERFFHHGFVLRGNGGAPLEGEIKAIKRRKRVVRPTPFQAGPDQKTASDIVTYVDIVYPLSERPDALTLIPPLQADGEPAADIGFIVYHQFIPVIDFQYLRGPETLRLDWTDPWYSAFDNTALQRHHRAPLMTFLYIEPYAVRFEILMRLKELAAWMTVDWQRDTPITPDEQTRLLQRIGQFFLTHSNIRIDGERRRPMLDRAQFVTVTQQGIQPLAAAERLTFHTAVIGVILAYATDGPPQNVTVMWELFNNNITSVPASIIDPVSALPYDLTPDEPALTWKNMLANYNYDMASIDAIAANATVRQIHLPLPSLLLFGLAILWFGGRRVPGLRQVQAAHRIFAGVLMLAFGIALWPYGRVACDRPFAASYHLPKDEARSIVKGLLQNTYRAFDFRREDDIYDKLAMSVTGDLVTDIYLQSRKSLELEERGGARARVQEVELLDLRQIGPPGDDLRLTFRCTWTVAGSVEHWGHRHGRRNQYDAKLTIKPVDHAWKIAALDLIGERRLP